ncbi:MAG: PilT/PilU family type 4a pilus ATPase [Nannocystaceae bacterium]|nr:PilT/PilU family type 4a pilus ATPase [Nannocystaceae bacterium]
MAVVDSLLKLIVSQGADALIFIPDEAPRLEKDGEPRPLSMPYPGDDIVHTMVQEVATSEERKRLEADQGVETRYTSDDGETYLVKIEARAGRVRLAFRRPKADGEAAANAVVLPDIAPSPRAATVVLPTTEAAETSAPPAAESTEPHVALASPTMPRLDEGIAVACEPGSLREALDRGIAEQASDILLSVGRPPHLRVGGDVVQLSGSPVTTEALLAFIGPALSTRARHELETTGSTDIALLVHDADTMHRYRGNFFRQHHGLALALRPIRRHPPSHRELNLPDELLRLVEHRNGLVLVTGTTGSGKSTTLVSLIEHVNRTAAKHVVTLEDPIEYEYTSQRALIHQRQLGSHVDAFTTGLRAALRESPDIILLGEMRDHATIAAALTAAETGHLVLSTLHAGNAPMAIDRMVDVFPEHQQNQVRNQLAAVLRAVVTQVLLPTNRPPARVPAIELMVVNTPVATKIREGRGHQLLSEIQKGRSDGMIPLEASLASLVRRQLVSVQTAVDVAPDAALFQQFLRR